MVIGTAGELPKPPSTPIQFLEGDYRYQSSVNILIVAAIIDMNESELANAVRTRKYHSPPRLTFVNLAQHACWTPKVSDICFGKHMSNTTPKVLAILAT